MMLRLVALATVGTLVSAGLPICLNATQTTPCVDFAADFTKAPPADLASYTNNSLFSLWRPRAHVQAPEGYMNDPQGLWVASDGVLTAGYQHHPKHIQWGNISMASAKTTDLYHWADVQSSPNPPLTLFPSEAYDHKGVFDGTVIPRDGYKGFPTILYTGVSGLPLGYKLPDQGLETISLAWTEDEGISWKKYANNPVIPAAPKGYNITGWRDPFVFQSARYDSFFPAPKNASAPKPYYMTISSGIEVNTTGEPNPGPRLLLYKQATVDFTSWDFLGPVFGANANSTFSKKWSGSFGFNFETATTVRLNEEGLLASTSAGDGGYDFVTMGTEGGRSDLKDAHWPLWVGGQLGFTPSPSVLTPPGLKSTSPVLHADFAGVADWGETYAFVSFPAPYPLTSKSGNTRQIAVGWTYEDELTPLGLQRGWNGALTFMREVFVSVFRNIDTVSEIKRIAEPGSWVGRIEDDGTTSVVSMGSKLAREIDFGLRNGASQTWTENSTTTLKAGYTPFARQPTSRHYMLEATISGFPTANPVPGCVVPLVGFEILRSPDGREKTQIYYDFVNENVVVNRSLSSLVKAYNSESDVGPLRLWNMIGYDGYTYRQELQLQIVVDNSIVEIYINGVFAMTTRVYPWLSASINAGVYASNADPNSSITISDIVLHDQLSNAWPTRPAKGGNAQVLIYDGPGLGWDGF